MKLCLHCSAQFEDESSHCPADGTRLVTIGGASLIGTVIDERYRIDSIIGRGSTGVVYKAFQELVGRPVAVKVLHSYLISDQASIKRFQQEARAASRLKQPNIITVFDYGVLPNGLPYIAMDYLEGVTLSKTLYERKLLSIKELTPIIKQVADALGEAHNQGVVHLNVTPDNIILVESSGNKEFVKVVDFGIAKLVKLDNEILSSMTQSGKVSGSPIYMSPERFGGKEIDQRSDIYSLGVIIFECLVGRPPFASMEITKLMHDHLSTPPPLLKDVRPDLLFHQDLENVVAKALQKSPADRQASMAELRDELVAATNKMMGVFGGLNIAAEIDALNVQQEVLPSSDEMVDLFKSNIEAREKRLADKMKMREEIAEEQKRHVERQRDKSFKVSTDVSLGSRLFAYVQIIFPYVMCLVLLTIVIGFVRSEPIFKSMFFHAKPKSEADVLINEGKLHQAMEVLEEKQKKGELTNKELDSLNRVYLRLAKHFIKYKEYRQAKEVLEKVHKDSSIHKQAEDLLRRLK